MSAKPSVIPTSSPSHPPHHTLGRPETGQGGGWEGGRERWRGREIERGEREQESERRMHMLRGEGAGGRGVEGGCRS